MLRAPSAFCSLLILRASVLSLMQGGRRKGPGSPGSPGSSGKGGGFSVAIRGGSGGGGAGAERAMCGSGAGRGGGDGRRDQTAKATAALIGKELRNKLGQTAVEMAEAGFSQAVIRKAGFSVAEMHAAGVLPYAASYSAPRCLLLWNCPIHSPLPVH